MKQEWWCSNCRRRSKPNGKWVQDLINWWNVLFLLARRGVRTLYHTVTHHRVTQSFSEQIWTVLVALRTYTRNGQYEENSWVSNTVMRKLKTVNVLEYKQAHVFAPISNTLHWKQDRAHQSSKHQEYSYFVLLWQEKEKLFQSAFNAQQVIQLLVHFTVSPPHQVIRESGVPSQHAKAAALSISPSCWRTVTALRSHCVPQKQPCLPLSAGLEEQN